MKRPALPLLAAVCAALALALLLLWFNTQGQWRNSHWRAPDPVQADFAHMLTPLPEPRTLPTDRFMTLLERPLFSEKRRPPPPPPPPLPSAPVHALNDVQLHAIYAGEQASGVIVLTQGKSRRVRLHESLEGWTLTAVQGRTATFMHSGQIRQLQLIRAKIGDKQGSAPGAPPAPRPGP